MRFLRSVNPHDERHNTAIVTVARRDLFSPVPTTQVDEATGPTDSEELNLLQELVASRITFERDSERPAKRRRLHDNNESGTEAARTSVSFRLLSVDTPIDISLLPRSHAERKAQWPAEDSSDERKRRHAVAKAAAVEGADITIASTSKIEVDPFNCRASRIGRTLIAADSSRLAPLFVAQVSHPADKRTRLNPRLKWDKAELRQVEAVSCCPVVDLERESLLDKPSRRTKRGRRRPQKTTTGATERQPMFWRSEGLGGQSLGYAMGWPTRRRMTRVKHS